MPYPEKVAIEKQRMFFKKNILHERLWGLFYIVASLALIILDQGFHRLEPVKFFVGSALRPIQERLINALELPYQTIASFADALTNEKKVEALSRALSHQKERENYILALEKENAELTKVLHLVQDSRLSNPVAAKIIKVGLDPFITKIILNKGLSDHIARGDPVITEKGLLGQVIRLYEHHSEARLITEIHQSTPVEILPGHATGIAFGNGHTIKISYLSPNMEISVGNTVITSGLDGLYPRYLKVGTITQVIQSDDHIMTEALAKPLSVDGLSPYVAVIRSSQTLDLGREHFITSKKLSEK